MNESKCSQLVFFQSELMSSKPCSPPLDTRSTHTHNQASSLQGLSFLRKKGIKVANDPVMLTGYKPLA